MALGIGLLKGPTGMLFSYMSEAPLHALMIRGTSLPASSSPPDGIDVISLECAADESATVTVAANVFGSTTSPVRESWRMG